MPLSGVLRTAVKLVSFVLALSTVTTKFLASISGSRHPTSLASSTGGEFVDHFQQ